MTEFWVSNAKHYCKYCKVWMQGDRVSIRNHESGKRHQEALLEFKKERSEAKRGAALDERELQKQLREIEKAAAAAVDQDLASGAVRFSEKVSGAFVASRYGGSSRGAPPPPPPPPGAGGGSILERQRATVRGAGGDGGEWDCPACGAHNFKSRTACFRCSAPRPPQPGEPGYENEAAPDDGVYTIKGVTYLDGKIHEAKLRRNTTAQVWVEAREEWFDCVVLAVKDVAVAHVKGLTLRSFTAAYYTPEQLQRAAEAERRKALAVSLSSDGGAGTAGPPPPPSSSSSSSSSSDGSVTGVGLLQQRDRERRAAEEANDVGPTTVAGLNSDRFRLIALDEKGTWHDENHNQGGGK